MWESVGKQFEDYYPFQTVLCVLCVIWYNVRRTAFGTGLVTNYAYCVYLVYNCAQRCTISYISRLCTNNTCNHGTLYVERCIK